MCEEGDEGRYIIGLGRWYIERGGEREGEGERGGGLTVTSYSVFI